MNPDDELTARIRRCADLVGGGNEMSRRTGIARRSLENYLTGREPKATTLAKIARAADVRLEWLIAGEEPMRSEASPPPIQTQSLRLPMDHRLMGLVVETVRRLMSELNMRLPDAELGRIYLELYAEILAKAEGEEDYPALLELAGNRLRREILKAEPGSGKRSA